MLSGHTPSELSSLCLADSRVQTALSSVVSLLERGRRAEPPPVVRPLDQVRQVHESLDDRTAPPKSVLVLRG